jgi:hypothetical protein
MVDELVGQAEQVMDEVGDIAAANERQAAEISEFEESAGRLAED